MHEPKNKILNNVYNENLHLFFNVLEHSHQKWHFTYTSTKHATSFKNKF